MPVMVHAIAGEMADDEQECVGSVATLRNIRAPSGTVGGMRISRLQWISKCAGFHDVS